MNFDNTITVPVPDCDGDYGNIPNAYSLRPLMYANYKSPEVDRRIMIVIGSVPTAALRQGTLAAQSATNTAIQNVFSQVPDYHQMSRDGNLSFMVVNFNHAKTVGLPSPEVASMYEKFTVRVIHFIRKYRPTDILVLGDTPAPRIFYALNADSSGDTLRHALSSSTVNFEADDLPKFTAGRGVVKSVNVEPYRGEAYTANFVHTFDIEYLVRNSESGESNREDTALVDMLFMVVRHVDNLLFGKTRFSLSHVKPNPVFIDTVGSFDDFMGTLSTAKRVAYDCETDNLSSYHNALLTSQFAFDTKTAYIIPHEHKDTKKIFTPKARRYIKQELGQWFGKLPSEKPALLIGTNLQFDLRIARVHYSLNFIFNPVWDVTAGEALLDENTGLLDRNSFPNAFNDSLKTPMGNLRNMACEYGNTLYYDLPFSKEQRVTISSVDIMRPEGNEGKALDVWDYMALDCQIPYGIFVKQVQRAQYLRETCARDGGAELDGNAWEFKYHRHVSKQMSNTVHALSHMAQHGSHLDIPYLRKLANPAKSPLVQSIDELTRKITDDPVTQRYILEAGTKAGSASGEAGGLFTAYGITDVSLDINKPDVKRALFFGKDYLNLDPINVSKITKLPSVDKALFKEYQYSVPLAAHYQDWSVLSKFLSTYIVSWLTNLLDDPDGQADGCLRPSYGFFSVVTGRLNSFKPSLHQIPSRNASAKSIKRAFTAKPGCLQVKWDFSAHEIRMLANESGDENLASLFRIGQLLRKEFIACVDDSRRAELLKELKTKGDIHIANVARFFGVWVDKEHDLRNAIKVVIFGLIYGMSLPTLAKSVHKPAEQLAKHKATIAAYDTLVAQDDVSPKDLKAAKREADKARKTIAKIEADPDKAGLAYVQDIVDKLWSQYPVAKKHLDNFERSVESYCFTESVLGRRRNLCGGLSGIPSIMSSSLRRGKNAPIQGVASEVGITSGYLVLREHAILYATQNPLSEYIIEDGSPFIEYCRTVHDANYYQVPYCMVLPDIHVKLHMATYGVTDYYTKEFGYTMIMEPEIEIEISYSDDKSHKWDFDLYGLLEKCVLSSLCESHGLELSDLVKDDTDNENLETLRQIRSDMKVILKPWADPVVRNFLCKKYPLLGVPQSEIDPAMRNAFNKLTATYKIRTTYKD